MIKRTPQEIADFFQCYVAKDKSGYWYAYKEKPTEEDNYFERWYISITEMVDCKDDIDWKDSLCEPRITNGISEEEYSTRLIGMLSNIIIANMSSYKYTEDLKQIADHYGQKELFERLLIGCAEMSIAVVNYQLSDNKHGFFKEVLARLEILLEQVKYLMKIDPVELGGIKKQNIAIQQSIIAKESHEESTNSPQKVHEKSANEEE